MPFSTFFRISYISFVLAKHGLDEILYSLHLFRPIRFMRYVNPWMWRAKTRASLGHRMRLALSELGPIFVKFGQMLSTRRDMLPDEVADQLAFLQDKVEPFPSTEAVAAIEKALGDSIENIFASFESEPLASASIAQVHAATLKNGKEVIVKVLRPGIEKKIRRDIKLLYMFARMAVRFWSDARRLRPVEIIAEYETTILDELDLVREAANASELRRNFENNKTLYIPEIEWDLCKSNVLVMERIYGIPVSDIDALKAAGVNLKKLSARGVEVFFTQVFSHNFFHADMHPGNIFVSYDNPQDPQYIGVDFGIMGTLTTHDQRYLAENFVAFFNRDYRRVAELHVNSGWVKKETRVEEFESAIRTVCEPMFQRPLSDISFGHLLIRLFQTARRFDMEVQPQLVLLQKTLLNIEGLGRQLDPELNLWTTAKPFLERWMSEQLGPRALLKGLKRNLPYIAEKLPDIPDLAYQVLHKAAHGELEIIWKSEELEVMRDEIKKSNKRISDSIIGGSLLITSALLLNVSSLWLVSSMLIQPYASLVMAVLGLVFVLKAISKPRILRAPRR